MFGRYRNWKLLLLIADILSLFGAFHAAYWIRFGSPAVELFIPGSYFYLTATVVLFYFLDLYNPWSQFSEIHLHVRAIGGVIVAGALSSLIAYALNDYSEQVHFGRGVMAISFVIYLPFSFLARLFITKQLDPVRLNIRLLVLASPDVALHFHSELQRRGGQWQTCYLLDRPSKKVVQQLKGASVDVVSNGMNRLGHFLGKQWTAVIVASDRLTPARITTLMNARLGGVRVYDLTDFYEHFFFKLPVFYVKDSWFLVSRGFLILENTTGRRIKIWADKLLAVLFLFPCFPLILLSALFILLESGRPILFSQERTGENGRPFRLFKLRSMVKDAEKDGAQWAKTNDRRITRLGRILRITRLDELPQLFNILRGDMSFIGPRPERPVFNKMLEREIPFYNLRHGVRPGLTGWAQVMYPYGASVEDSTQKLEYDLYYIKNFSYLLDFLILLKTVKVVIFRRGR